MGIFKRKAQPENRPTPGPPHGTPADLAVWSDPASTNLDRLRAYLDGEQWRYNTEGDLPLLSAGVTTESGEWRVWFGADPDGVVSINSVLGQRVPEERRIEVAHLLTLANFALRIGAFRFDFSDGELRFHSSIDVEGSTLTWLMVHNLLGYNLNTMERYYRAIMEVSYGNVAALTAFEGLSEEFPSAE